jgi:hypothetical protein
MLFKTTKKFIKKPQFACKTRIIMRQKISLIILVTLAFCVFANGQTKTKPKSSGVVDLSKNAGQYPFDLFKNKTVKARMKKLLGKNYANFFDSFETQSPFKKKGNVLFSSGCLIHACGHLESAIAIDLATNTIHLGIFRQDEAAKTFNENKRKTPKVLTDWFKNLKAGNK